MTKFTLDIVEDYPYFVVGINTPMKGYRTAWALNRALDVNLKRVEMLEVKASNKEVSRFTFFSTFVESLNVHYRLVENRSGGSLFIPEYPRADYLLVVDHSPEIDGPQLVKTVRNINLVSTAFEIDVEALKSRHNILLTT